MKTVNKISEINLEEEIIYIKPNKHGFDVFVYYCLLIEYENKNRFKITFYDNNNNFMSDIVKSESYHCLEEIVAILAIMENYTTVVFENSEELINYKNNYNVARKLVR